MEPAASMFESWTVQLRPVVYSTDPELFRQLCGVAAGDPDVAQLMPIRVVGRRNFVSQLVARLDASSRLRPGISHEDATAILLALTRFATFDQVHAVADARLLG